MEIIRLNSKNVIKQYEIFSNIINLVNTSDQGYIKIDNNKNFIPLSVEIIDYSDEYIDVSFAHYNVQNGDLMADPEVCFKYYKNGEIAIYYYKNDYAHIETFVVSAKQSLEILGLLNIWLTNLKEQQFKENRND